MFDWFEFNRIIKLMGVNRKTSKPKNNDSISASSESSSLYILYPDSIEAN